VSQNKDIQVVAPALVWHAVADCLPLFYHVVFLCQADPERLVFAVGSRREEGWHVAGTLCPLNDFSHWLYCQRPGGYRGEGDLVWAVPVVPEGATG
jgi:hypothetical protein